MVNIQFNTGNAAFEDSYDTIEIARILRDIADKIESGRTEGKCIDYNGNGVGTWSYEKD